MSTPPDNPPIQKPSTEDSLAKFIEATTDYMVASMRSQTASLGLQNSVADYSLQSDRIKLFALGSLLASSWVTVFLLIWITLTLQFHSISSLRPQEIELRPSHVEPVQRPYEIHGESNARAVA